ncbi:MAG: hypothetical protein ACREBU_21475, partial [Nitrososphaera sp.]
MSVGLYCWENTGSVLLDGILDWCLREHQVDTLLATARSSVDQRGIRSFERAVDSAAKSIFGDRLIKRFDAYGWPGTKLIRHTGWVYVVRFDEAMKQRIVDTENELFEWTHYKPRPLPEDICLFRSGSRYPALVSVTHERDAWIISDRKLSPPGFKKGD